MEAIRTEEYKGYTIEIHYDDCGESPREWDNLGNMICFHNRYNLGDKQDLKSESFDSWNEMAQHIIKELKAVIVLPLFLYDHSGISMKVGSFNGLLPQGHAEFDSGQVGFIYATKEQVLKNYMVKRLSKKILERAEDCLRSEVKVYDQFLRGEVYGFKILDKDGEEKDSCWGFYGDTDEIVKECEVIINDLVGINVKDLNNTKGLVLG